MVCRANQQKTQIAAVQPNDDVASVGADTFPNDNGLSLVAIELALKPTRREAWRHNLSGPRGQRSERPHASGDVRPASFGADKLMRAHAIVATMIAPAIAMV